MRNTPIQETAFLSDVLSRVDALLPDTWTSEIDTRTPATRVGTSSRRADAVLILTAPDGTEVRFDVEAKPAGTPTRLLLAHLRERATTSTLPLLVVSDYLGTSVREALVDAGISYADGTGWVRISTDAPLILLTGHGAERSPRKRESTAVVRLNGVAAGRIICTLCTQDPPLGVRELASLADVSPGSVSKTLPTLADEGVLDRAERGLVTAVYRRALIRRWTRDYSFLTANGKPRYFIAPRGLERTMQRLETVSIPVTLTGSAAARRWLPEGSTSVVPLRLLALYAESPERVAEELRLIPADASTANVVVAEPKDPRILTEALAPVPLVLGDLLTLPGRSDAEAEQLMDALANSDPAWRA